VRVTRKLVKPEASIMPPTRGSTVADRATEMETCSSAGMKSAKMILIRSPADFDPLPIVPALYAESART
jgi:hypothetical protein